MTNYPNLGFGAGLRPAHYAAILDAPTPPNIDWFEIISENYMDTDGRPRRMLEAVLAHYPVVMHGVSLSIGSTDPLNRHYLSKLKALADWVNPPWISDHLCWTGIQQKNSHDLLPVPYTEAALAHIIDRIKQVQDVLGQPFILENPSTYLEFRQSTIPEWEFLARMVEGSGCGLLLDVNNVYVSCFNHRLDPKTYLDALPMDKVAQIHLAGHSNQGTHIVDTHDNHVVDEVWELYRYVLQKTGPVSTMVEWDANIPDLSTILAELDKARAIAASLYDTQPTLPHLRQMCNEAHTEPAASGGHIQAMQWMQSAILTAPDTLKEVQAQQWVKAKPAFPPADQIAVYHRGYRYRLFDALLEEYPATAHYLGRNIMFPLIRSYIEATPSQFYNLSDYLLPFADYVSRLQTINASQLPDISHISPDIACELATLDAGYACIFDMPESPMLDTATLHAIAPESLAEQYFAPRTASALYHFSYPVHQYRQAVKQKHDTPALPESDTYLCLYRHADAIQPLPLDKQEYALLCLMQQGLDFGTAIERYLADHPQEHAEQFLPQLQHWLVRWVEHALLTRTTPNTARLAA